MVWQHDWGDPNPWGGKPPGRDRGGRNGETLPPEIEVAIRRTQQRLRRLIPGGAGPGKVVLAAGLAVGLLWLGSGFYRVLPDEQGVVLRFGGYNRTAQPGLNYALPAPIEQVLKPKVTHVNRIEVGFRGGEVQGNRGFRADVRPVGIRERPEPVPEEALMLTGDENIVDVNFSVLWSIKDGRAYLFNVRSPESVIKAAAESAMREVIGRTPISTTLAEGRRAIEADAQRLAQDILDAHKTGVQVVQVQLQRADPPQPVIDAFRDVQRARADQERLRNEAEAYRNDVVPRARGEADRIIQEAEAYRQEVVARAQGEAARFTSVLEAYEAAPSITRQRIYLETKRDLLSGANKVLVDDNIKSTQGVLPYLPLPAPGQGSGRPAVPSGNVK